MYVTIVYVKVKPEYVESFINLTLANAKGSVKEPGNLRFDVLQSPDNPCEFVLYEAYRSEEAARAHKTAAHYLTWREAVAEWMAEPRRGIVYRGIFPE